MLDILLVLVIILCAFISAATGIVKILFSTAALLLGIAGGIIFNAVVTPYFIPLVSILFVAKIIAFLIIFIIIFLAVKILQKIIAKLFEGEILKGLDRTLGFFFGIVEGIFAAAAILFILSRQPFFNADSLLESSFFYRLFVALFTPQITVSGTAALPIFSGEKNV